jgi:dipeptidyl aminopeptidase/acylaminoacyl peptidase
MTLDVERGDIWRQRFRASSIAWAVTANLKPKRGLVCTDRDGIFQLYAWDVDTGELRRLTDQATGVVSGLLSADGNFVYYMQDDGGNEIGHFVRIPYAGGFPEDVTPDLPPYGSFQINQSFRGNLLGSRVADPSGQMLYVFAPGEPPRLLHKSNSLFRGPSLSYEGEIAVIATTEGTGSSDTRLVAFDLESGEVIAELWDGDGISHSLGEFAPLPGDFRILSSSSKSGFPRPIVWNPCADECRDLALGDIDGEVHPMQWSRDAKRVLLSQRYQGCQQLYLYDLESDRVTKLQHPEGTCTAARGAFTDDGRLLVTWQDVAHPSRLIALDGTTGVKVETVLAAGDVPDGRPWDSVSYASENGDPVHGWLAVPEGEGPFPTILHTHGGPTAAMLSYFLPACQAWLDHGFAFLTINYHGSTTFGKAFEKSIIGQLGELEVEDMAAGYQWLVDNGIAQPDAVFVTGGSYGGFLTLLAVGRRPDLWAGGMADVAIGDWSVMYEDESESLRAYQRVLFDGTPEEKPEEHAKSSPITYAEQIQAPLLVIQGSNDTRCPARQMREYEARLKSLGKEILVHWFEAGHGSRAQEQRIAHQERKMRFAREILGARAAS